jgi:biopolymer transport protein ExbD
MNGMNALSRWSPSRIAIQRAAPRGTAVYASIHHLPMVATAVRLLILMMVTAGSQYSHHDLATHLARSYFASPQPSARREDVIKVAVRRDGSVFFRNSQIAVNDLPGRIREAVRSGSERKVYWAVDRRTRFSDVAPVLDQIRAAGIREISFLAERVPMRAASRVAVFRQTRPGLGLRETRDHPDGEGAFLARSRVHRSAAS